MSEPTESVTRTEYLIQCQSRPRARWTSWRTFDRSDLEGVQKVVKREVTRMEIESPKLLKAGFRFRILTREVTVTATPWKEIP